MAPKKPPIHPVVCKEPFLHIEIPNLLPPKIYTETMTFFDSLEFTQQNTDTLHFFQTPQLTQHPQSNNLKQLFWENLIHFDEDVGKWGKHEDLHLFAQFYGQGDYNLCTQVADDRVFDFFYFLDNHDSHVVLFNKQANKPAKTIKPIKNMLLIFQVSDSTYYEFDQCVEEGMKIFSGYLSMKGQSQKRIKTVQSYVPSLPVSPKILSLPPEYLEDQYVEVVDVNYSFNVVRKQMQGPFYERRVQQLQISPCVVFDVPGYELLSAQFYLFEEGSYILQKDPINHIFDHRGIVDIFVVKLCEGFVPVSSEEKEEDDEFQEENALVKFVEEGEKEPSGIPEVDECMHILHRGKKVYYVDRVRKGKEFMLAHFIYTQNSQSSLSAQEVKVKKSVKKNKKNKIKREIRQKRQTKPEQPIKERKKGAGKSTTKRAGKSTTKRTGKLQNKPAKTHTIRKQRNY